MRSPLAVLAAPMLLLAAASPSVAGVVTQTITGLEQPCCGLGTGNLIYGMPFNTALGTLTSVGLEMIGLNMPAVFIQVNEPPPPPTVTLTPELVYSYPTHIAVSLGSQTVPVVGGHGPLILVPGKTTPVDTTVAFTDLAAFETGPPVSQVLVTYGFLTGFLSLVGVSLADDVTTFSGEAILTYDYSSVPEPATALIFGTGLLGLAWCRRRSA